MCPILSRSRTSLIQEVEIQSTKIQEYIVSTTKSLAHVAICLAGAHWPITDLLFLESGLKFKNLIDKNFCYQSVGCSLTSITININVICHLREWGSQFTADCGQFQNSFPMRERKTEFWKLKLRDQSPYDGIDKRFTTH